MFKKGDLIRIENKLSGSRYDGIEVTEVTPDEIRGIDVYDNEYKLPFKFWKVEFDRPETEKRTIKQFIIENESKALIERATKLEKIGAPKIVIEGARKQAEELKNGQIKIGGDKALLDLTFGEFLVKTGSGGRNYIQFDNGVNYFPNAKYGRYITK